LNKAWREIACDHIPKAHKIYLQGYNTKLSTAKKIGFACHREVKRTAYKTRMLRDVPARARKSMRDMLLFWRRNEKEERELRKKAEKAALERLKQEEEEREAKRQARKLNFLITQTELYSHFVGKKLGTDKDEVKLVDMKNVDTAKLRSINFDDDDDDLMRARAQLDAQNALHIQQEKTRTFDASVGIHHVPVDENMLNDLNFHTPSTMGTVDVPQPKMLMCQLKNYQLKGLNWLVNLYEQGINGILADEMGLGKTVQAVALMAYLAESQNIWGPFLVVAPASTLHNWQQEIARFLPNFRVLPYWGTAKDRQILRKSWSKLYTKDPPFHVLITSYQLVVVDEKYFQRVKWQYMVLDEAQAIKSSSSLRWKTLLGFNCRNRVLLTGTPIQNSMQELWALLHFIMPTLFDSHDEFSEWFSKDIESHAENKGSLNEHQLRRLHMILKPFMLRRIKKHVQHELGEKIEKEVFCELNARQRRMYNALREKISLSELLQKVSSMNETDGMDSLMNLVVQFRKVCNHPELFERAEVVSPVAFNAHATTSSIQREGDNLYLGYTCRSHVRLGLPKLVVEESDVFSFTPTAEYSVRDAYLRHWMNLHSHVKDSTMDHPMLRICPPMEPCDALDRLMSGDLAGFKGALSMSPLYMEKVVSPLVELMCNSYHLTTFMQTYMSSPIIKGALDPVLRNVDMDESSCLVPLSSWYTTGSPRVILPSIQHLLLDSGKLQVLDQLLTRLKSEGHRVLIYFQMTKMIDLMEEYLTYRQHSYLRLDGSSTIADRRDMVSDWQTRDDMFVFLLSTRAGGLGINLTAADTVIFYDSDWNPTVDQQAMDRAHRLGQTKQVTVYRLITRGTIEERILIRAKQKDEIQKVVISGQTPTAEFKPREIMSLLLEDE
jgi:DNA helicase INO80